MTRPIIEQRTIFFLAVEGEGEQSFIKWLQWLSDRMGLHVHLDCQHLGGGGYKTMLDSTMRYRKHKGRNKAKASILLVDGDRAVARDDGWSLDQLREESAKEKISICIQNPNQEGLYLRMMPKNEHLQPSSTNAHSLLRKKWPAYQKPADARTLDSKFSLDDLLRVARVDSELRNLLMIVGLCS